MEGHGYILHIFLHYLDTIIYSFEWIKTKWSTVKYLSAKDDFVLACTHLCIVHLIDKQALAPDDDWASNEVLLGNKVSLLLGFSRLTRSFCLKTMGTDYLWVLDYEGEISLSIHRFIVLFELNILSQKINILNIWRLESSLVKKLACTRSGISWSDLIRFKNECSY